MSKTASITTFPEFPTIFNAALSTTSQPACTWIGHCLGDSCKTDNDCDNDWICPGGTCSPCCETTTPHHGLNTAGAVGIGVAIPAFLAIMLGIAYLVWRAYRKNRSGPTPTETPGKTDLPTKSLRMQPSELSGDNTLCAEMASSSNPVEADTIELVELEGNYYPAKYKGKIDPVPEPYEPPIAITTFQDLPAHQSMPVSPRRFEEHVVSLESRSPVSFRRSPTSDISTRPIYSPAPVYQRLNDNIEDEPISNNREGSDQSYRLFRWPSVQRDPERRAHR